MAAHAIRQLGPKRCATCARAEGRPLRALPASVTALRAWIRRPAFFYPPRSRRLIGFRLSYDTTIRLSPFSFYSFLLHLPVGDWHLRHISKHRALPWHIAVCTFTATVFRSLYCWFWPSVSGRSQEENRQTNCLSFTTTDIAWL